MIETVKITLWDKTVGYLSWDASGKRAVFEYDPEFPGNGWEISPLMMPLSSPRSRGGQWYGDRDRLYHGLPPVFADSLPDRWGETLFAKWCAQMGVTKKMTTPLDHLVFIGTRGIGALEYEPAMALGGDSSFAVDIEELYAFSRKYVSQLEKVSFSVSQSLLWQDLVKVSSSPGGKHPKAIVAMDASGNVVSGQGKVPDDYTHYIVKYDSGDGYPYAQLEYVFYRMAIDAGIVMSQSELREFGSCSHFLTRRFDRNGNDKYHLQTLAAMDSQASSYEDAFTVLRKLSFSENDKRQLFLVMAFNVLCGNVDDHNKNISFIMTKDGKWRLAPAYDMTFSVDFNTLPMFNRHELSVCGKFSEITKEDLLAVAQGNDIDDAKSLLEQICQSASSFHKYAGEVGIPKELTGKIKEYIDENIRSDA